MTRRVAVILIISILVLAAGSSPVLALQPQVVRDLPLVPVSSPDPVQLIGCVLEADLSCDDDGQCTLSVSQTYQVHNTDRVEDAVLRLGLPAVANGEAVRLPEPLLQDGGGTTLTSLGPDGLHGALWQVKLAPDERQDLVLSYTHRMNPGHFLHWQWAMSLLSAWGEVGGLRVEFRLPHYTTEDAFLSVEPGVFTFDGTSLLWEYESLEHPPHTAVQTFSPNTWTTLQSLRLSEAHGELARLYLAIQEEAKDQGVALPDLYEQIVAELQAALSIEPDNVPARLDLAQVYRDRAEAVPELRLNYLLLSAQELARLLEQGAQDGEVARTLSRTYYEAATIANESGDPAGALVYLKKAAAVPGAQLDYGVEKREYLTLRWALDLAEQGLVDQALSQLAGELAPQTEDAILRYSPPFASVRTEVELNPRERVVYQSFGLYPPSAAKTHARLQDIVGRIEAASRCPVELHLTKEQAILEVRMAYQSLPDLERQASTLVTALSEDSDLTSTIVAAPWQTELRLYVMDPSPWCDRYRYQEQVDLGPLHTVWEAESQYIGWRLIELRSSTADTERTRLEQRLALIALREQSLVWQHIPSSTYWVYRVYYQNPLPGPASPSWLVSWGQTRELELEYPVYHWNVVILAPLLVIAFAVVFFANAFPRRGH